VLVGTRAVTCLFVIGVTILVQCFVGTRAVTCLFVISVTGVSVQGLVRRFAGRNGMRLCWGYMQYWYEACRSGGSTVAVQGQGPYAYQCGILSYHRRIGVVSCRTSLES
jgi:hypothetical protein